MVMNNPLGRLKINPNFWHANPTVGVYTIGNNI